MYQQQHSESWSRMWVYHGQEVWYAQIVIARCQRIVLMPFRTILEITSIDVINREDTLRDTTADQLEAIGVLNSPSSLDSITSHPQLPGPFEDRLGASIFEKALVLREPCECLFFDDV